MLSITKPLYAEWGDVPEDQVPPEVLGAYFAAECSLPLLYGCEPPPSESSPSPRSQPRRRAVDAINQTIAQPCLIEQGEVPQDGAPCPTQELGPFDGTEAYYNSGFLGFETDEENIFELNLSDTIAPGVYNFYCAVHGSFQSGTMEVVPSDQPIPSASEVNQQTRQELNEVIEPFRQVYDKATEGQFVFGGEALAGPFSGLVDERVDGSLNEFVPEVIETGVGDPVTWLIFGGHSISFDVPEYFPIYEELEDGTVAANEAGISPGGGSARGSRGERPARAPRDARPSAPDHRRWHLGRVRILVVGSLVQRTLRPIHPAILHPRYLPLRLPHPSSDGGDSHRDGLTSSKNQSCGTGFPAPGGETGMGPLSLHRSASSASSVNAGAK